MTLPKNQRKPNGHAGGHDRANGGGHKANGHTPASTDRGGVPVKRDQAASDDAGRASLALGASGTHAPGTDCQTYAEVAPLRPNGNSHAVPDKPPQADVRSKKMPAGEFRLPDNPAEFVDEIHRRVDLFEVWQKFLESKDDKIRQRAVEKLTEMRYKGAAALADEPQQIVIDIDSAVARRAMEGARK